LIEVLDSNENEEMDEEEDVDLSQLLTDPIPISNDGIRPCYKYGFMCAYQRVFEGLEEHVAEVYGGRSPDSTPIHLRPVLRFSAEAEDFDVDQYISDLSLGNNSGEEEEEEESGDYGGSFGVVFDDVVEFIPFWKEEEEEELNEEEREILTNLPRKVFLSYLQFIKIV